MAKRVSHEEIIQALELAGGFQSRAANMLGISRQAVFRRIKKSQELQEKLDDIRESYIDLAEYTLLSLIRDRNFRATKYYLSTQGKNRGYIEKHQVDATIDTKTGVLVVPGVLSGEEWEKKANQE